jgi:NADPH2:quinone reductase
MKTWWIVTRDHVATLEKREMPVPVPGSGHVVVKVHAAGMNRGELIVGGAVHGGPEKFGGVEVSGVVETLGPGVTGVRVGDRVMGRVRGAFTEYALMETHQLMPLPPNLTWEQGAAVPVSYTTAYEMICQFGFITKDEWLLIAGASSGAGVACMQIAQALGAHTIGTSGSAAKLGKLATLGLEHGICTRGPDFAARVMEITGGAGADIAANLVGGTVFPEILKCLARCGRVAIAGYVDGALHADIDLGAVHASRFRIYGVSNAKLTWQERAEATRGFSALVLPMIANGRIVPVVDRVYGFDELPAAKAAMEANEMVGKIIVRVA